MKTKQTLFILVLALVLILAFTACGSKSAPEDTAYSQQAPEAPAPEEAMDGRFDPAAADEAGFASSVVQDSATGSAEAPSPTDKIIYSGDAEVETLEFDKSLETLAKMIADCGGFVQSSYITGNDFDTSYYGGKSYRTAEYSIRIPADKFKSVTESLSLLGNVPYSSTNADNITMQYRDVEARLTSRQTEEARLLELLAKANTVEEILQIESRLSDVRYEIESLTSQIKNWDNLISYSTLNLTIREVTLYTDNAPATLSYGEQLKDAFVRSLKGLGRFFKGSFKLLVAALPVLVVLAVVAIVVVAIVKAARKKKIAKISDRQDK